MGWGREHRLRREGAVPRAVPLRSTPLPAHPSAGISLIKSPTPTPTRPAGRRAAKLQSSRLRGPRGRREFSRAGTQRGKTRVGQLEGGWGGTATSKRERPVVQNWVGRGALGTSSGRRCGELGGTVERRKARGRRGARRGAKRGGDLGNFSSKHGIGTEQSAEPPPQGEGGGGTGPSEAARPGKRRPALQLGSNQPSREI